MRRIALLSLLALATPAGAARFVVDDPGTAADAAPGDGACATAAGRCTALAAVAEAEARPGPDEIHVPAGTTAGVGFGTSRTLSGDLAITGSGQLGGDVDDMTLVVPAGVTLSVDEITLGGCSVHAVGGSVAVTRLRMTSGRFQDALQVRGGGTLTVRGSTLDARAILVEAGGAAFVEGTALSMAFVQPLWSCIHVAGGTLDARRVTGASSGSAANETLRGVIHVSGGEARVADSDVRVSLMRFVTLTGGAVTVRRTRILGARSAELSGQAVSTGPLLQADGGTLELDGVELWRNWGGGVRVGAAASATLRHVLITECEGPSIDSEGSLRVEDSVVSRNTYLYVSPNQWTSTGGLVLRGGTATIERVGILGNGARSFAGRFGNETGIGRGGGVVVTGGACTFTECRLEGNGASGAQGGEGGGAWVDWPARFVRCSFIGNAATEGGAIATGANARLALVDTTVAANDAAVGAGISALPGTAWLWSSTIADNGGDGVAGAVEAADSILAGTCSGTVTLAGWVLVERPVGCTLEGDLTGVLQGIPPGLAPLDLGSRLPSHVPMRGSPARDAARPAGNRDGLGRVLAVDQLGVRRILDGDEDGTARGDLGAREACDDLVDSDRDGLGDACDPCPLDDSERSRSDADHDGIGDACDAGDADRDGVADRGDTCPDRADPSQADADGDGLGDACDRCALADDGADADDDGVPDTCDCLPGTAQRASPDADEDGTPDDCDPCPTRTGPAGATDFDSDGVADSCDDCPFAPDPSQSDLDVDGVGDACDRCLVVSDPAQRDADGDRVGDACDPDLDGDGAENDADNCPGVPNADQADGDGDGIGDACDAAAGCPEPEDLRVARRAGGGVRLSWRSVAGTTDVYEGVLASVADRSSASPVACEVPLATLDLPLPAGNVYWLAGGRCGAQRSAIGADSLGIPTPLPRAACP